MQRDGLIKVGGRCAECGGHRKIRFSSSKGLFCRAHHHSPSRGCPSSTLLTWRQLSNHVGAPASTLPVSPVSLTWGEMSVRPMGERLESLQIELEALRLRLRTMEQVANVVPQQCVKQNEVVFLAEVGSPQARALAHARQVAMQASRTALPSLLLRGKELGLTGREMATAIDFLRHRAPLCIHVSEPTLHLLASESHYKCYHEIHGHNAGRDNVENIMYNDAYTGAQALEKIKYGCLSVVQSPAGVLSASVCRYGRCWLEMKNSLRCRVTLHYGDSLGQPGTSVIGTVESLAHILASHSDSELKSIVHAAQGGSSDCISPRRYVEVHYHGSLVLDRDVHAIHVPTNTTAALETALLQFKDRGIKVKRFKPVGPLENRGPVEGDY